MKSYLISMLAAFAAKSDAQAFRAKYPHDWLLWEPGKWQPPMKATISAAPGQLTPNVTGEALALALEAKRDPSGAVSEVDLGRARECALELNDGTLSGRHMVFAFDGGTWRVRDAGSRNGTQVDGKKLLVAQAAPLSSGMRLQGGQVVLTFYTPDGMYQRLRPGS